MKRQYFFCWLYLCFLVVLPWGWTQEAQETAAQSWQKMSGEFRQALTALQTELQTAWQEAETSKSSLISLTSLYRELLQKMGALEKSLTTIEAEKKAETARANEYFCWGLIVTAVIGLYIVLRVLKAVPQTAAWFKWVI